MHLLFYGGAQIRVLHNQTVECVLQDLSVRVRTRLRHVLLPALIGIVARQSVRRTRVRSLDSVFHRHVLYPDGRPPRTRHQGVQVLQRVLLPVRLSLVHSCL